MAKRMLAPNSWVCVSEPGDGKAFNFTKYHDSEHEATTEAQRLVENFHRPVYILKVVSRVVEQDRPVVKQQNWEMPAQAMPEEERPF